MWYIWLCGKYKGHGVQLLTHCFEKILKREYVDIWTQVTYVKFRKLDCNSNKLQVPSISNFYVSNFILVLRSLPCIFYHMIQDSLTYRLKNYYYEPKWEEKYFPNSSVGKEFSCSTGGPSSIPGSGRSAGEEIGYPLQYTWASLVAQLEKNLPAIQETWVPSLGWEGPLEKGKGTHSSFLA